MKIIKKERNKIIYCQFISDVTTLRDAFFYITKQL